MPKYRVTNYFEEVRYTDIEASSPGEALTLANELYDTEWIYKDTTDTGNVDV